MVTRDQLSEEAIFEAAFGLESHDARMDYLKQVCRDVQQVERIHALLREGALEVSFLENGPAPLREAGNEAPEYPERIGDFEILGELGRGGMGVVYRARQCSLNRLIALKVLSTGLALTTKAIMRFKLEAEAAAKLHHTNIVPIYWTGEENRVPYYAMELIDGPSLDRVIKQRRVEADLSGENANSDDSRAQRVPHWIKETLLCNSPAAGETATSTSSAISDSSSSLGSDNSLYDNVADMMAGVADALAHAHDQGIIHRDIKPANLLLSADGRLSINDFGLARMLEQPGMTMTGEFMGSPMYMSPEQITAGRLPLDHRTDIYSLGATLYEMLTLKPPFPGQRRDQVLSQVMHKDPPKPRSINPQIPKDLETICMKAMEKDPDRRYQTAEILAEDLRRFVNRHAISARRIGPLERGMRWVRKNKAIAAMACLTLLVGVVAAVFSYRHRIENRNLVEEKEQILRDQALEDALEKAISGRFPQALESISEAVNHGADPNWEPMIEAQQDLFEGNAADAVVKLQEVAERDPENITARWMLAEAYWGNGQASPTAMTIQELNGTYPSRPLERLFAAKALGMADPKEASRLLDEVIRENRQFTYARTSRAGLMIFQAMDKKDGDIELVSRALGDIQIASTILEEEQEVANPNLSFVRLYAHLTAVYLYRRAGNDEKAEQHLKDAKNDALYLGDKFPNYFLGNFARLYYYQFNEDFDGMYEVMQHVIKYRHRGWIADPFWVTCYMDPEWAHRDPEWANVQLYDLALDMLDKMPHQDDDYVAFSRLVFRLEKTASQKDVEDIYHDYRRVRSDEQWDWWALLLTGSRPATELATGRPDTRTGKKPPAASDFRHAAIQYATRTIDEDEFLDRAGPSERNLVAARFIIGLQKLAERERDEARKYFNDAANGTMYHWTPFNWSRAFADRLKNDPKWPHWPILSGPEKKLKDEPD